MRGSGVELIERLERLAGIHVARAILHRDDHAQRFGHLVATRAKMRQGAGVKADAGIAAQGRGQRQDDKLFGFAVQNAGFLAEAESARYAGATSGAAFSSAFDVSPMPAIYAFQSNARAFRSGQFNVAKARSNIARSTFPPDVTTIRSPSGRSSLW